MTKQKPLAEILDEYYTNGDGKGKDHTGRFIDRLVVDPTNTELLFEITLRLKQLVALKTLETIHEGRGLFYDDDLGDEDFDEAVERERQLDNEAKISAKRQYEYATRLLEQLNDAQSEDFGDREAKIKRGNN